MHIAHFTNTYHPVVSGVVRSVSAFRQGLTELGHNVFVFAQHASKYTDDEPFIFRYPATIELPLSQNFPLTIPVFPTLDEWVLPPLKLDVIHSHHPFLLGQSAASKADEFNLPLIFTFHTRYREYSHYFPIDQKLAKRAIDRLLGDYMEKCQHIVVPSDSIKEMLAEQYGVTEQITTVPTGLDLKPFQIADGQAIRQKYGWGNDKVLISIGRLAKEKNWETLLTAAAEVIRKHSDVRLVIIGDGEERKALNKVAQDLNIAGRVEFAGQIPFGDVPSYLKAADLFCFASVTETQGLVTMEAIAAGLPVVAVNATGTRDVIEHAQEGLLTDNDSMALARAISQVIDDEALLQRFREGAKKRAEDFDIIQQAKKLLDVYHQAIEDKKANQFVRVDKRKRIFQLMIDEEWWDKLLGHQR